MGCDIHGYWELRNADGVWVAFREVNFNRSYAWFAIIADVRSSGPRKPHHPTARRGVPKDASAAWRTYTSYGETGLHSHTWLTYDEVAAANRRMDVPKERLPTLDDDVEQIFAMGPDMPTRLPWFGNLSEVVGDQPLNDCLRLVIAFDN